MPIVTVSLHYLLACFGVAEAVSQVSREIHIIIKLQHFSFLFIAPSADINR